MHPELFRIGGFVMNSYGAMLALAFIVAGIVAYWQFKKRGVRPDFIYPLLIAAVVGGLLGAKIHYLIIHPEAWPENILSGEGLVWFGGLFGAVAGVVVVTLVSKQRLAAIMDSGAIAVAIGYAVGRIGCLLRGCCYGVHTDLPWGMEFPLGVPPTPDGAHVHPTQLYSIITGVIIFALLAWVIGPRFKREGPLMFAYAILAGVERFGIEFIRANQPMVWGLTQQQWIAIAMVVVGVAGVWWFETRGRLRSAAPLEAPYGKTAPIAARGAKKRKG